MSPVPSALWKELIERYEGALSIRQMGRVTLTYTEEKKQYNCDTAMKAALDLLTLMNELLPEPEGAGEDGSAE